MKFALFDSTWWFDVSPFVHVTVSFGPIVMSFGANPAFVSVTVKVAARAGARTSKARRRAPRSIRDRIMILRMRTFSYTSDVQACVRLAQRRDP